MSAAAGAARPGPPPAADGGPAPRPGPVRILADDLTGALDTAATFALHAAVPVRLDRPAAVDDAAVSVVSTGTRDVPVRALASALAPCVRWLADAGIAFKKVDSLLRGNALAEVAELLRAGGFERALFAPAFPAQGRRIVAGRLEVGPTAAAPTARAAPRPHGVPAGSAGADPLADAPAGSAGTDPLTDAPAAAGAAATPAVASPGPGPLADAFAALGLVAAVGDEALAALAEGGGPQVLVPDAATDADLDRIVALALASRARLLWCGSAGLAQALVRHGERGTTGAPAHAPGTGAPSPAAAGPARPLLLVTATRHPVLRGQLARLGDDPAAAACTLADLADPEPLDPPAAAQRLAAGAARVVAAHPRPACVVVVGGDTLLALCRAAGVERLAAEPAPRPGWGAARLEGGAWSGVRCLTRSGAFGAPDDLVALLRAAVPSPSPEHR